MRMLNRLLLLDETGKKGLCRAVLACTLTSLSLMIPFSITMQVLMELMKPLTGGSISWNRLWLLFVLGLVGFIIIFLFSKNDYKKTYGNSYGQAEATRLRVAEQVRKLPMSFFNSKDLSELSSNMVTDCTNIEQTMASAMPQLIANIISITFICVMLAFFDWRMALSVFITLPIAILVFWLSRKLQKHMISSHVEAKVRAVRQSQEYLEGIKVIRACGLGGSRFKALDEAFLELKTASLQVELAAGSIMGASSMILRCGVGVVAFVGVALLTRGEIAFIPLLMFLLIVSRIYGPVLTVLTLLPDMLYLQISSRRLRELMDAQPMSGSNDTPLEHFDITFADVTFAYNQTPVLQGVNFTASEGDITALVGPSGSGKSTVAKLAARFWDADTGAIRIGGVDVKELDPEYLMRHISFVFQDVTLFNDTIADNIRLGRQDASDEEVRAAAGAACCDKFINRLPDGYNTMLGENGATLSGGERQRISIARALLKDAPIVLLDEATASLDPENEVAVQEALSRLIVGKTVLVIAHRLRTIADADNIVVLQNGQVVEEGTHQKLTEQDGLYKKLHTIQQENMHWVLD